jgi:branched-chain amino acid transport system substrate-binding protein
VKRFLVLALTVVGVLTAITPLSPANANPKNVTIAFQGPLTGPESKIGIDQLNAVKFAVHHFNKRFEGEINVSIFQIDDQGDPSIAQSLAAKYASNEEILGLVGSSFSGASIASLAFYKPANLPMISPSASRMSLTEPTSQGEAIGFPVFHRVVATDTSTAPALYKISTEGAVNPKVFIVDDQGPYGVSMSELIQTGGLPRNIVGKASVSDSTTDWSATINQIKSSGANVVIFTGYYPQAATLFNQLRNSGYVGTLAGTDAIKDPGIFKLTSPSSLEGIRLFASTVRLADLNTDLENNFEVVTGQSSGLYAGESIDAANVFLYCIAKGVSTRLQMLNCVDYFIGESIYGNKYAFDKKGDLIQPNVFEFEIQSGVFKFKEKISLSQQSANSIISNFPWFALGSPEYRVTAAALLEAERAAAAAKLEAEKILEEARIQAAKVLADAKISESKVLADKAVSEAKLEAARILAAARNQATKKTTITCVKGKLTKKVTAVKPKCPTGYKVKK